MIISQSEEVGLGGLPTVLIRRMGGTDFHLSLMGALAGLSSVLQIIGPYLLKWKKSNRRAMQFAMISGCSIIAVLVVGILGIDSPGLSRVVLPMFLLSSGLLAVMQGVQWNLESSWIGDLVPVRKLGWFTSLKWILATMGIVASTQLIGRVGDAFPNPAGYASIYLFFGVSYLAAYFLYGRVTDRTPKASGFFGAKGPGSSRVCYRSAVLWLYIAFYTLWVCGRGLLGAFTYAYLLDAFQFNLTDMAWLTTLQFVLSCFSIFIMGRICSRFSHRGPLIFVVVTVSLFQFGYTLSAWWGLAPIIIFTIINAMAGHGFSMLAINFGLEIFPDSGRANYLALTRFVSGIFGMVVMVVSGFILGAIQGVKIDLFGATLGHYHLLFFMATLVTLSCAAPLLLIGKRRV